jgi:hypothetical protein
MFKSFFRPDEMFGGAARKSRPCNFATHKPRAGHVRAWRVGAFASAALLLATLATSVTPQVARAEHKCDPVTDEGWSLVPEEQTLNQTESAPYRPVGSDNWYVDRITTVLPFCHYYNSIGIYSMRSYSLDPRDIEQRVEICRATGAGGSVAVTPYKGPCPPRQN